MRKLLAHTCRRNIRPDRETDFVSQIHYYALGNAFANTGCFGDKRGVAICDRVAYQFAVTQTQNCQRGLWSYALYGNQ